MISRDGIMEVGSEIWETKDTLSPVWFKNIANMQWKS